MNGSRCRQSAPDLPGLFPERKPIFGPCNPSRAKREVARPYSEMVNAAGPYDSYRYAEFDRLQQARARWLDGDMKPPDLTPDDSQVKITLFSKDAETMEYEKFYIKSRAQYNKEKLRCDILNLVP